MSTNSDSEKELDFSPAEDIINRLSHSSSCGKYRLSGNELIPLLQRVQDAYGYLPAPVLSWVSERTGIPTSRMYGVITFYSQFYLEPHGKHTVRCCRGTACHVRGGKKVISEVKSILGIDDGETREDMLFSLETVACLGACALAPVMVVDNTYYGKMTPRRAAQILQQIMQGESS
jgi:NADH-quinone oxidoreductase subunit E